MKIIALQILKFRCFFFPINSASLFVSCWHIAGQMCFSVIQFNRNTIVCIIKQINNHTMAFLLWWVVSRNVKFNTILILGRSFQFYSQTHKYTSTHLFGSITTDLKSNKQDELYLQPFSESLRDQKHWDKVICIFMTDRIKIIKRMTECSHLCILKEEFFQFFFFLCRECFRPGHGKPSASPSRFV